MPEYRYFIGDTNPGSNCVEVTPLSGSEQDSCKTIGRGTHTFSLGEDGLDLYWADTEVMFQPWTRSIIVDYDGRITFAGTITGHRTNEAAETIEVRSHAFRIWLSKRLPSGIDAFKDSTYGIYDLDERGGQLVTLEKGLVGSSPRFTLPVNDFEDSWVSPGTVRRTHEWYAGKSIEQIMKELEDLPNGSDLHFRPQWRDGVVGGSWFWERRLGTPRLQAPEYDFDIDSPLSGALDVNMDLEAINQVTGVVVLGGGKNQDTLFAKASAIDPAYTGPWLDEIERMGDIDDQAVLNQHAQSIANSRKRPRRTLSLAAQSDGDVSAGERIPGVRVTLHKAKPRTFPAGTHTRYVTGWQHRVGSELITLDTLEI
ncbi:hypothetical protein [Pseudoclavibacter sp. VKM Ac-2888]|uniref:hypothetical protein n=1 Tax=Pseudoclavibacter sp. VKM Ac-2888 TaxID=2783830 RepID=UPI001889CD05|nr:hypothetical protein [Pseudoclavibacter sp. VKM Ac-2888]MBF4549230.1 hypothetical protein [Pseudoclavibacter sp. VKM Ac-2888]